MKIGDLVKGYTPNPYQSRIGIVVKTDSIWDGNEIVPSMIEVLWSGGKLTVESTDDILVINENR
tara:strand:- start:3469 stop:3660 length:192 start_codon:yes stop_codon:yes gene_type:complete